MHLVALFPASGCCWTLGGGDDFLHLPSHPLLYPLAIISMNFPHLSRILPPLHQCFTWPGMECDANSSLFYDVRIFAVHSYRDIVNSKYLILLRDSRTIYLVYNKHCKNTGPITTVTIPQGLSILLIQHTVLLTTGLSILLKPVLVRVSRERDV